MRSCALLLPAPVKCDVPLVEKVRLALAVSVIIRARNALSRGVMTCSCLHGVSFISVVCIGGRHRCHEMTADGFSRDQATRLCLTTLMLGVSS
jgi:hypothetical protein